MACNIKTVKGSIVDNLIATNVISKIPNSYSYNILDMDAFIKSMSEYERLIKDKYNLPNDFSIYIVNPNNTFTFTDHLDFIESLNDITTKEFIEKVLRIKYISSSNITINGVTLAEEFQRLVEVLITELVLVKKKYNQLLSNKNADKNEVKDLYNKIIQLENTISKLEVDSKTSLDNIDILSNMYNQYVTLVDSYLSPTSTLEDLSRARDIISLWLYISNSKNEDAYLFAGVKDVNSDIEQFIGKALIEMESKQEMLNEILFNRILEKAKSIPGLQNRNLTIDSIKDVITGLGLVDEFISDTYITDVYLNLLTVEGEKNRIEAWKSYRNAESQIDEKTNKVIDKLKLLAKKGGYSNIYQPFFKQVKGKFIPELVTRVDSSYYIKRQELWELYKMLKVTGAHPKAIRRAYANILNFQKEQTIAFNPFDLFPPTTKSFFIDIKPTKTREEAIQELKDQLQDDDLVEIYLNKLERNIEFYNSSYEIRKEELQHLSEEERNIELGKFELANSPYISYSHLYNDPVVTNFNITIKANRIVSVPIKFYSDGTKSKWYNEQFDTIKADPELLEFYNFYSEMLHEYNKIAQIPGNKTLFTLPLYHNKFNLKSGWSLKDLKDKAKQIAENYEEFRKSRSVADNKDRKVIGTNLTMSTVKGEHTDATEIKKIKISENINYVYEVLKYGTKENILDIIKEYELSSNNMVKSFIDGSFTLEEFQNTIAKSHIRKDVELIVLNDMFGNHNMDLNYIMKLYAYQLEHYYHTKSNEALVNEVVNMAKSRNSNGNISAEESTRLVDRLDYKRNLLFNRGTDKEKTKLYDVTYDKDKKWYEIWKRKKFNNKEIDDKIAILEKRLEVLEKRFDTAVDEQEIKELETRISKIKDQIEQFNLSRTVEGSIDLVNKWFTLGSLGLSLKSAINNTTFGYISNITLAAERRYFNEQQLHQAYKDLINTSKRKSLYKTIFSLGIIELNINETYKLSKENVEANEVDLFFLMKGSEYVNQVTLASAYLSNIPADKYINGATGNLLDYLNENPDADIDITNEILILKELIARYHGDYRNLQRLQAKRGILGRSFLLFKTYLSNYIISRVQGSRIVPILGETKGRYRTLVDNNVIDNFKNLFLLTLHRTFLLGKTGIIKDRKLDKYSEIDAANLRAASMELIMYLRLYGVYKLLQMILAGEDEDEITYKAGMLVLNIIDPAISDLNRVFNPTEYVKFIEKPFYGVSLLKTLDGLRTQIIDDVSDWDFENIEGEVKILKKAEKLPGLNLIDKHIGYFEDNYDLLE